MKGLLIKDIRLLLKQKAVLVMILAVGVIMFTSQPDASFVSGYVVFITAFLALTTISYDNFDNGMAFIMTLPAKRSEYAISKYVIAILCTAVSGVVCSIFVVVSGFVMPGQVNVVEEIVGLIEIIAVANTMVSLFIPINLKFGAEKGRIIMFAAAGIVVAAGYFIDENVEALPNVVTNIMNTLGNMSTGMLAIVGIVGVVAVIGISMMISVNIIKNKEF